MLVVMPVPVVNLFRDIEVATPIVGELGSLLPRVYPSVSISTDVTNDPIEEEFRLTVPVYPVPVHFCHHEATGLWLRWISLRGADLSEDMSMELSTSLFNLPLEWVSFGLPRRDWVLLISVEVGRGTGGAPVKYP